MYIKIGDKFMEYEMRVKIANMAKSENKSDRNWAFKMMYETIEKYVRSLSKSECSSGFHGYLSADDLFQDAMNDICWDNLNKYNPDYQPTVFAKMRFQHIRQLFKCKQINTTPHYQNAINNIINVDAEYEQLGLPAPTLEQYVEELTSKGISPTTIKEALKIIQGNTNTVYLDRFDEVDHSEYSVEDLENSFEDNNDEEKEAAFRKLDDVIERDCNELQQKIADFLYYKNQDNYAYIARELGVSEHRIKKEVENIENIIKNSPEFKDQYQKNIIKLNSEELGESIINTLDIEFLCENDESSMVSESDSITELLEVINM